VIGISDERICFTKGFRNLKECVCRIDWVMTNSSPREAIKAINEQAGLQGHFGGFLFCFTSSPKIEEWKVSRETDRPRVIVKIIQLAWEVILWLPDISIARLSFPPMPEDWGTQSDNIEDGIFGWLDNSLASCPLIPIRDSRLPECR
jgi:hypothetical protein